MGYKGVKNARVQVTDTGEALTSKVRVDQKLLLTYRLLPSSTTSRPICFSNPVSPCFSLSLSGHFGFPIPESTGGNLSCTVSDDLDCPLSFLSFDGSSFSGFRSPPSTSLPRLCTTPSKRLSLARSSESGGFFVRRGARPGRGKMHSMPALWQLEHGCLLSHLTFLLLQVVHDLGFRVGLVGLADEAEPGD